MQCLSILSLLCASAALSASDALHVPLLVKYHQESHALAGAVTGLVVDYSLRRWTHAPFLLRASVGIGYALTLGAAKEYLLDRHPHRSEIAPWGWGSAGSFALRYTIRF